MRVTIQVYVCQRYNFYGYGVVHTLCCIHLCMLNCLCIDFLVVISCCRVRLCFVIASISIMYDLRYVLLFPICWRGGVVYSTLCLFVCPLFKFAVHMLNLISIDIMQEFFYFIYYYYYYNYYICNLSLLTQHFCQHNIQYNKHQPSLRKRASSVNSYQPLKYMSTVAMNVRTATNVLS